MISTAKQINEITTSASRLQPRFRPQSRARQSSRASACLHESPHLASYPECTHGHLNAQRRGHARALGRAKAIPLVDSVHCDVLLRRRRGAHTVSHSQSTLACRALPGNAQPSLVSGTHKPIAGVGTRVRVTFAQRCLCTGRPSGERERVGTRLHRCHIDCGVSAYHVVQHCERGDQMCHGGEEPCRHRVHFGSHDDVRYEGRSAGSLGTPASHPAPREPASVKASGWSTHAPPCCATALL